MPTPHRGGTLGLRWVGACPGPHWSWFPALQPRWTLSGSWLGVWSVVEHGTAAAGGLSLSLEKPLLYDF